MSNKRIIGLSFALVVFLTIYNIPPDITFTVPAKNTLALLLAVVILLTTEVLPIGIICLSSGAFLFLLGCVENINQAFTGFSNSIVFFVLASFGISYALTKFNISKRILLWLIRLFGSNTSKLLFAIMLCIALMSSIISNVASAAVFIPVVQGFLDLYESENDRKITAKSYMIALPISSMIGGMMTPAGSGVNLLALNFLEEITGETITFVQWVVVGTPLALVALPFAWFVCIKVFKPAHLSNEKIQSYVKSIAVSKKLSHKERYVSILVTAMLALWFLSSWVPVLNITAVALVGLVLLFIPNFEILSWKEYKNSISWEAVFLIGSMISFSNVVVNSGLAENIVTVLFADFGNLSIYISVALIALLTFALLIPIPVAPAIVPMLTPAVIGFAGIAGVSPTLLCLTLVLCASNCYLLPLDTVPLMTYTTGSYEMFDMPKVTFWVQIFIFLAIVFWLPFVSPLIGLH